MGVGYAASALHRITYLVVDEGDPISDPSPDLKALIGASGASGAQVRSAHLQSPREAEIISWRDKLAVKWHGQLGEVLNWDETNDSSVSEDTTPSNVVLLHYVAAIAEENGLGSIRTLAKSGKPDHVEIHRALENAERRGFTGQFSQLTLGPDVWLPFKRNLIMEEPDWSGKTHRFGSSYRLEDELRRIRALILEASKGEKQWKGSGNADEMILPGALSACATIERICRVASTKHLPLWTTG